MKNKIDRLTPLKHAFALMMLILTLTITACSTASDAPISTEVTTEVTTEAAESSTEAAEWPETRLTKDDLIYFIMVDRFADSNPEANLPDVDKDDLRAFQGGDLQGIIDNLDYIESLGATAIWLTPIMTNGPNGYHGYWIYDFYDVDPHFGDLATFKSLVNEAHKRDIKVILDYIVNHTGYNSPWLKDPEKSGWFNPDRSINNWKDKEEVELGWLAGLPDLDQTNPEVAEYFIENALWWIDETGIDGFRLDTMRHVPHEFWISFSEAIKSEHPDFFLLGEVWDQNVKTLESYHQAGIDSLTNYSLFNGIENAFRTMPNMFSLVNALNKESGFSNPDLNAIFIDNHDNSRFMSLNPRMSIEYTKQALTFIYSYPAIPVVYYGTEIGMAGAYDPENRYFMDWAQTDSSEMLEFTRELAVIRNRFMGDFKLVHHDKASLAYEIWKGDDRLLVVMNADEKEKTVTFDTDAKVLTEYWTNTASDVTLGGVYEEVLPPVTIKFYIIK